MSDAENASGATGTATIRNQLGLHLRAAKALMEAIAPFEADVQIANGTRRASARSILSLITLEATCGTEVEISATGPQAAEAVAALIDVIERRFGESE